MKVHPRLPKHYIIMKANFLFLQLLMVTLSYGQKEIEFRTDGIVVPRTTIAQVDNPSEGMLIYDINADLFRFFDGSIWQNISNPSSSQWGLTDVDLNYSKSNVSIGNIKAAARLDVEGAIKISDYTQVKEATGMIQFNSKNGDFEGFDGSKWISLTKGCISSGSTNSGPPVESMCCEEAFTLTGGSSSDDYGDAIAIDGNWAAVGAPGFGPDFGDGSVIMYFYDGSNWSESSIIGAPDNAPEEFGSAITIQDDLLVIGAPGTRFSSDTGSVYIFEYNGSSWIETTRLKPTDGQTNERFGFDVDISGDYIVVGSLGKKIGQNENQGQAYIFHKSASGWMEQAILVDLSGEENDRLGVSVAISGIHAIIGANGFNSASSDEDGKAYIFQRSGMVWGLLDEIKARDDMYNEFLGTGVSMDGNYAVVGAWGSNDRRGAAYVYKYNGKNWVEDAVLVGSVNTGSDIFGEKVSIKGDYIIVGAPGSENDEGDDNVGKAYVFHFNGMEWKELEVLEDNVGQYFDQYGKKVATDSANRLIVAPAADVNGENGLGKVIFGPIE